MQDNHCPLNLDNLGPVWSRFDARHYGRHDAAATRAARDGAASALHDYLHRGSQLGYQPNIYFDPGFYVSSNPEAKAAIASGASTSAYDHFSRVGWLDQSPHWLFNTAIYRANSPDLAPASLRALGGLYGHYLSHGSSERRIAHLLFDPDFYLASLPPDAAAEATPHPFHHYLANAGRIVPEPRTSPYFDPSWYLATYPDANAAVAAETCRSALHHYLVIGVPEGRDPLCDFSEQDYRSLNPDVDAAVREGLFRNAYDHFLNFGVHDPRSPSRDVDLPFYATQPSVGRDMDGGDYPNLFAHLLQVGLPAGLPLRRPIPRDFALDEAQTRQAFLSQARRALPALGRRPLDFTVAGPAAVSVIVILRNQFALTMQTLASLRHSFGGAIELIIVDNGSSDETLHIADVVRGARIIRLERNVGFLRGCNLALEHATAPAVLYLNNDVVLHAGSVQLALDRLARYPSVGAVGGKIVRSHGMLQEAGCILWRDGSGDGWMRDAPPDAPEANYAREVDFCSGCFLMVRAELLHRLGGFDDAFAPSYYEETDLCLRIQQAGFSVVYDPAVVLTHLEYASSRSVRAASDQMVINRSVLRNRHAGALRRHPVDRSSKAEAAAFGSRGRRVLFIEDTVPLHRLGSGYGRAADVLTGLVEMGWQATVFPMIPVKTPLFWITGALPDTAEILWDRDIRSLKSFLQERRGYYDLIWISRAHNLRQLLEVMGASTDDLGHARLVLDTEAVFSVRDAARAELDGLPFDLARAVKREFESTWRCDHIVATSEAEAGIIAGLGSTSVSVVGVRQDPRPTPRPFASRRGLLHVGTLTQDTSPNYDGLRWYVTSVQPLVERLLGPEDATLTVAGYLSDDIDLSWLQGNKLVRLVGSTAELTPLFDAHRVMVAPTRFGAGVPVKIVDAASFGMPVAATTLLAQQLGWSNRRELVCAPQSQPDAFARAVVDLYNDERLWTGVREAALAAVLDQASPAHFEQQLKQAVQAAGASVPKPPPAFVARPAAAKATPPAAPHAADPAAEEAAAVVFPAKRAPRAPRRPARELGARERQASEGRGIRPS